MKNSFNKNNQVIICVDRGKYEKNNICAQRGPSNSLLLKWGFLGEKIEDEETPHEASSREIKEEMQC